MINTEFKGKKIHVGDTIRVSTNVVEGSKTRVQTFEGVLISLRGRGENQTFAVRKVTKGFGVERTWPLNSNTIVDINVVKKTTKVRRAKLYFLRSLVSKMSSAV